MFDKFSPIEILKAFGIVYVAGIATAVAVNLYTKIANDEFSLWD